MQALLNAISAMPTSLQAARIFHGRGGLHSGCEQWTLDAYPPVYVLTSFQPATEAQLEQVSFALSERLAVIEPGHSLNWVYQCRAAGQSETKLMSGSVPAPHIVPEGGLQYLVHVLKGQNHGLFLDMANGRSWVAHHIAGKPSQRVLNLFAYTCAFSVVALQAGAQHVVNVDMSHGSISVGQQNHQLNGLRAGASFLPHDIFSTWGKITRSGPYDLIVMDPPSYQKGSFVATKDYTRIARRLPDLLAPGGHVLLCLNAPEMNCDFIHALMREVAPELQYVERVPNPDSFADTDPERALKVLVYRAP